MYLPHPPLGTSDVIFEIPSLKLTPAVTRVFIVRVTLLPGAELTPGVLPWPIGVLVLLNPDQSNGKVTVVGAAAVNATPMNDAGPARSIGASESAVLSANIPHQMRNDGVVPVTFLIVGFVGEDETLDAASTGDRFVPYPQARTLVAEPGALLRAGPSREFPIIRRLEAGEEVVASGYTRGQLVEGSDRWAMLAEGWVHQTGVTTSLD